MVETALKSEADGDGVCLHNQLTSGTITKFNRGTLPFVVEEDKHLLLHMEQLIIMLKKRIEL
jgi:hypothetical protein